MPRHGVQYVNNEEPSFIKRFKQRIGHKDEADINAKRNIPNFDDDDSDEDDTQPEREDEKPVVVVLKDGHLTEEEAQSEQTKIDQGPARLDEKIKFKKPTKRTAAPTEEVSDDSLGSNSTKKKKDETKKAKNSASSKSAHNKSLLSFGDEEEEEEG
ncbi:hypothetical protein ElyMa_004089400 [Elysia marginata]|uniref:DUF4604 domain-containing protein n=1 Tax=Elysia marginata TaxID=1093978 RepID=A0AAV4G8K0_9GAST|nr:hypothetical protein ElyMa_004089400 [Elysia marginata]